jgi:thiamine-monophosphate kinase
VHEDAIEMRRRDGRTPLEHALHDGEDYELLFTGKPDFYFASTRVGTITQEPGVWLQAAGGEREELAPRGWEHRL